MITSFGSFRKIVGDYDAGWRIVETDVRNSVTLAEELFEKWQKIKGEDIARHHPLSMFGAKWD